MAHAPTHARRRTRADAAPGHLTRMHADFVFLCLSAHHHHFGAHWTRCARVRVAHASPPALPILDEFVWRFDDKAAEANVEGAGGGRASSLRRSLTSAARRAQIFLLWRHGLLRRARFRCGAALVRARMSDDRAPCFVVGAKSASVHVRASDHNVGNRRRGL